MSTFAVISLAGKQHVVRAGQRLLVDRLPYDEGKTFEPTVLVGGEGDKIDAKLTVTALVVGHTLGEKIRIGKYKKRTGYKRHNGYRSHLSQIEIQSVGAKKAAAKKAEPAVAKAEATTVEKPKAAPKPKAASTAAPKPKAPAKPKAETAAKPKAAAKPAAVKKAPAKKPAAKKTEEES
ncbi:MAG: large subunit ribosomal protein [Gaiellaceae bacterium]|jgi:large subunit ribosomal protein L21|nr:large subunit ribosomal protein [Gaiellaceae bacterium]